MPVTDTRQIAAAILAGGNARRLGGIAKGLLAASDGGTFLARLIRELHTAGVHDIVIVANNPTPYAGCGLDIVPDVRPGQGPLGGIEAALTRFAGVGDATLCLPCDLPEITAYEISGLVEAYRQQQASIVYAQTAVFCHPLCAVVHNGVLGEIAAALDRGERKVSRVWRQLGAVGVSFASERAFMNVNTVDELAAWKRLDEEGR